MLGMGWKLSLGLPERDGLVVQDHRKVSTEYIPDTMKSLASTVAAICCVCGEDVKAQGKVQGWKFR
jgi:hypothetical protein